MNRWFLVTILFFMFFNSCTKKIITDDGDSFKVNNGSLILTIDLKKAPSTIASLKGTLTRTDDDTIFVYFTIMDSTAHAEIENIPPGQWFLEIIAYDQNHSPRYGGSTYVDVQPGRTIPVFLNLQEIQGGIDITVTWGGVPRDMMLLMAQNPAGQWRIILMKSDGSKQFDLIDGRYPIWTDEQRSGFVFLRGRDELCRYDLSTHRVTTLNFLGVNANFLFYAPLLNRILFDYKYFGDYSYPWQLGSVDTEGQAFHTILNDTTKKKYPATPSNSDWIYYHVNHGGTFQIYRIKHDGSQNQPVISGNFHCEFPSFDRPGQRMVFSKISLDSTYRAVVIHDMATGQENEINVTELGQATYPVFTYDGTSIIFSVIVGPEHRDRQLFRYHISTGRLEQITFGHAYYWYARPIFW